MGEDARLDDFVTEERVEDETSSTDGDARDDTDVAPESPREAESTAESTSDDVGAAAGDDDPSADDGSTADEDDTTSNPDGSVATPGAVAAIAEGTPGAVERTTYWRPDESTCERCGSTAHRLWNEDGARVCSDCAAWQR